MFKKIMLGIYIPLALILGSTGTRVLFMKDYRWWMVLLFSISVIYCIWFFYEKIKELKKYSK